MIDNCDVVNDHRSWVEIDLNQLKLNYLEKLN